MIRYTPLIVFVLSCIFVTKAGAQSISVNVEDYNADELTELLLENACVEFQNSSYSSSESVAYFNNNNGAFPIDEGVIMRTGKAKYSEGLYTGNNMSSQLNNNSEPFLDDAIIGDTKETTSFEFKFKPLSSDFSFNFVFASNEYGQWQCVGSDTFAFILTNTETGAESNIAVIPSSGQSFVSVKNIKDSNFNSGCPSENADLFNTFNVNAPNNSSLNMRGFTDVLNASTSVQPGVTYKARLVISDMQDANFDSAVFIESGSFTTDFDLGQDISLCQGSTSSINTSLDPEVYNHQWSFNGNTLQGETDSLLTVDQTGNYSVEITKANGNCVLSDTIEVQSIQLNEPGNIKVCSTGNNSEVFNLNSVNASDLGLNNGDYDLVYYASAADAQADIPIPANELNSYDGTDGETIFVRVTDTETGVLCSSTEQFDLLVNDAVEANAVSDLSKCLDNSNTTVEFDLTQVENGVLGANQQNGYSVSYHLNQTDAQNAQNNINTPGSFSLPGNSTSQTIWVRVSDDDLSSCFATTSFEVSKNENPDVTQLQDTVVCSSFVLPPIQYGTYYDAPGGPNGNGQELSQGDIVDDYSTYYIFSGPDENGCTRQSSFELRVLDKFSPASQSCGSYTLPTPPDNIGTYYTASNGPNGSGTELPPGTTINQSQTVYYYAEYDGSLCTDSPTQIDILPRPTIDHPDDILQCDNYTLPALNNGSYYTEPNGNGTELSAGETLTESQIVYVYTSDGQCDNQDSFKVVIPRDYDDVTACDQYELPDIIDGGYYTQQNGQGNELPDNTVITQSQTVYYFRPTNNNLPCSEIEFEIEIVPSPSVDTLENQVTCIDSLYSLPALTDGEYFTESGRNGTQLNAGDDISETQEIFINNSLNNCTSETSFTVEVLDPPSVSAPTNVYECAEYILPELDHGHYFTQPGGQGDQLFSGNPVTETQTIFVYRENDQLASCYSEKSFIVNIRNAQIGEVEDVNNCGPYVLPERQNGNYFSEANAEGDTLFSGDTIYNDQTVYVFNTDGERFPCTNEDSIVINISETPTLGEFDNINQCGEYELPADSLPEGDNITSGFYRSPNGEDLIDPENYTLTPGQHTIYAYAEATDNPDCSTQKMFSVDLYPRPELNIPDGSICRNFESGDVAQAYNVETGIDTAEFDVKWFRDGEQVHSGANFAIAETGDYEIKTTKLTPETPNDCNYKTEMFTVSETGQPLVSIHTSQDFGQNNFISVEILQGMGTYKFKLDDQPYQTEPKFTDVESGEHIVKIKPIDGQCGVLTRQVVILSFPKFFTPNQDGKNDTWSIPDLAGVKDAKVYIFNRYGKLLSVIEPGYNSWDGNFNGKKMPANDYWFRAEYTKNGNKKTFKSHFTLKR